MHFVVASTWLSMNPSSILIWNARGLNQKDRRNAVRDVILSTNADVVCLQETKVADMTQRLFLSSFGSSYDKFITLPANGTRGGVLIAWKSSVCQALASRVDHFSVSVRFTEQEGRNWWFTGVCRPQDDDEKVAFLQELREVRALCSGPWLVAGDFNLIYKASDKNNSNLDRAMMRRFRCFLDDSEVLKIPLFGRKFTWSNEGASPTLVRLDRAFCYLEWEGIFPDAALQSAASSVSDHCPLILGLKVATRGKRRFHFESFWPKLPGFIETVQQNWSAPVQSLCAVEQVFLKLQRLSKGLQKWSHRKVGNVKLQLDMAKEVLHRLEIARDSRALGPEEDWLRRKLKLHCLGLASLERTIARLRSRILYLREGDANTSFFHQQARY
jgi:exonuclease III